MDMISKARRVLERDHELELLVNRNVVQKGDQEGFFLWHCKASFLYCSILYTVKAHICIIFMYFITS